MEAMGHAVTEPQKYKSAQLTSQPLPLQGKHAQRASALPRSRVGINEATRIKSWTPNSLHSAHSNTSSYFTKPSVQTIKNITSLSQSKLLVNLHATVISLASSRLGLSCCCPVPASFSTDSDPPAVGTAVSWLIPTDPSVVVSQQLRHRSKS